MTRYEMLWEAKEELKVLGREIRALKQSRKLDKRGDRPLWRIDADIFSLRHTIRWRHISYCEIRGRSREQIERPREGNEANERIISKIKEEWLGKIDEDVCVSAE